MENKEDKKIKLLIIVKSIDGGTGTFLLNFLNIKDLFDEGTIKIKPLILECPTYRDVTAFKFEYLRDKNFYPQRYSLSPSNFLNFFRELLWIKEKAGEFKPDVILSIDLRCNLLAIFLKILSLTKIKVIATNHIDLGQTISDKSTRAVNLFLRIVIKFFYDKADKMICVSKELSKNLKKYFSLKKEVITIYNGQPIMRRKTKKFLNRKKKVIITIARLVEQKDHITLVKAFSLLLKLLPKAELWIASNGPEKDKIQEFVKSLHIENKVKFLGWVKNINFYLKKADIFVLSSRREGFGYVLVEAMARGLPILSTDTPHGPSEVLGNGKYGILVPMDNPTSLKDGLEKLLTDNKKYEYFAKKSIERSNFFSLERMLEGYKKIILDL